MRVALVHTRYRQHGGEEVAFEAEADLLATHGHDVHVITTDNSELESVSRPAAAVLTVWNERRRLELADRLRAIDADVVHFHNTFPLLSPAVYYGVPRRAAVVQTLHNYRLVCPAATLARDTQICEECVGRVPVPAVRYGCYRDSRLASAAVATMLQVHRTIGTWSGRIDAYIALTPFARRVFVRGGLADERLFVKPNFVAPDPGVGSHAEPHYLFAGRLDRSKGVDVLLDAFSRTKLPLRIIGTGPMEPEVRAAAAVADNIVYAGTQPRRAVLEEMRDARAIVIPSVWYEGFPFVVVEALATGLPVISSDLPNLRELAAERGAGWTFLAGNGADLARVLQDVDAAHDLRHMASRTARRLFESDFTGQANHTQLVRIYDAARRIREARLA